MTQLDYGWQRAEGEVRILAPEEGVPDFEEVSRDSQESDWETESTSLFPQLELFDGRKLFVMLVFNEELHKNSGFCKETQVSVEH